MKAALLIVTVENKHKYRRVKVAGASLFFFPPFCDSFDLCVMSTSVMDTKELNITTHIRNTSNEVTSHPRSLNMT